MTEKVADIRNELIGMGMSEEEVMALKPKSVLVETRDKMLQEISEVSEMDVEEEEEYTPVYQEVEELETLDGDEEDPDEYVPDYDDNEILVSEEENDLDISNRIKEAGNVQLGDKNWQDKIMAMFNEDELIDNPKDKDDKLPCLAGLSRVGHLMFNVVYSGVKSISTGLINNHPSCTVVYQVDIQDMDESGLPVGIKTYTAAADAWSGSMNPGFDEYPAAIAESRAEARVWKKMLHLRNKPSYEEVSNKLDGIGSIFDDIPVPGMINDNQIAAIEAKCDQFDIDVYKFINKKHFTNAEENPEPEYSDIKEVPYEIAQGMASYLNKLQTCTEDSLDIPEEIMK